MKLKTVVPSGDKDLGLQGEMSTALGHSAHKQYSFDHGICGGTTTCQQWGPEPLVPELVPLLLSQQPWRRSRAGLCPHPQGEWR